MDPQRPERPPPNIKPALLRPVMDPFAKLLGIWSPVDLVKFNGRWKREGGGWRRGGGEHAGRRKRVEKLWQRKFGWLVDAVILTGTLKCVAAVAVEFVQVI